MYKAMTVHHEDEDTDHILAHSASRLASAGEEDDDSAEIDVYASSSSSSSDDADDSATGDDQAEEVAAATVSASGLATAALDGASVGELAEGAGGFGGEYSEAQWDDTDASQHPTVMVDVLTKYRLK